MKNSVIKALINEQKKKQDAKRVFTKEILMRIDIKHLARRYPLDYIREQINDISKKYGLSVTMKSWENYIEEINQSKHNLMSLF